jgi:hypothetical protein
MEFSFATTQVVTTNFPLCSSPSVTKLPPLCSPSAHPSAAHLCSVSLTVALPSAPICLSTLDDGAHFGSWGIPFRASPSNTNWSPNWAFRNAGSMRTMLPPPSTPIRLEAVVESPPVLPALKCLSLPLLSSLLILSSRSSFQLASILLFLCSLLSRLFVVNLLQSSTFSSSCFDSLAPGTISALSDLMGKRRAGFFGRAREKGSRRDRSGIDGA